MNIDKILLEEIKVTKKLTPGLWKSYTNNVILIKKIDLNRKGLFKNNSIIRWTGDEWDESPVFKNMRYPSYILEHFKKIDLEKQNVCPVCEGKKKTSVVTNFEAGGGDFFVETKEEKCFFCKDFKKIKKGNK